MWEAEAGGWQRDESSETVERRDGGGDMEQRERGMEGKEWRNREGENEAQINNERQ